MTKKIVRPEYDTKLEQMAAEEREHVMDLQDKQVVTQEAIRSISRAVIAIEFALDKVKGNSKK